MGLFLHFSTKSTNVPPPKKNFVNSFFLPLSLSHTELIKLCNIQLIPILAYRPIYNSLPNKLLDTLDHSIWVNIASQGKLSLRTPNKTKYSPRHTLGLGITKISHVTHTQAINHFLRYTSNEGPPTSNHSIQHTLFHRSPASNLLQDMLITSAHHFSIQTHNIPHHNPAKSDRFHSTQPSKSPSSTTTTKIQISGTQAQASSTISTPHQSNSPTTSFTFTTPTTSPSSLKRATNSLPLLLPPHTQYAQPHYKTSPSHIPPPYQPHIISSSNPTRIFPFPTFHIWIIGAVTTYSTLSNPTPPTLSSIPTDRTTPTLPTPLDQPQLSPFNPTTTLSLPPPLPSKGHTQQKSMPSSSPSSTLNSPPSPNRSSSPSTT